jgi:hypothetical protein
MYSMRNECKGYNAIIFACLYKFNGEVGAMVIKYKYPFLSPLCTFICRLNEALKPLNSYFI